MRNTQNQNNSRRGDRCKLFSNALVLALILPSNVNAAPSVLVPIPSITIRTNSCTNWMIQQTYTATPLHVSVLDTLALANQFSHLSHYHIDQPGSNANGRWETQYDLSGTTEEKLSQINKKIFGTKTPSQGQTATFTNNHSGSCAADQGMRECVGVFIAASGTDHLTPTSPPTTFPSGMCVGIPPADIACIFMDTMQTVDLGSGGMGQRAGSVPVEYKCSRPTTYTISLLPQPQDESGIDVLRMTINGVALPFVGTATATPETARLGVEAVVNKEGFLGTSRVLMISVP